MAAEAAKNVAASGWGFGKGVLKLVFNYGLPIAGVCLFAASVMGTGGASTLVAAGGTGTVGVTDLGKGVAEGGGEIWNKGVQLWHTLRGGPA